MPLAVIGIAFVEVSWHCLGLPSDLPCVLFRNSAIIATESPTKGTVFLTSLQDVLLGGLVAAQHHVVGVQ